MPINESDKKESNLVKYPLKVLLIDDQEITSQVIQDMLRDEKDIFFEYCQDPTRAIEFVERFAPTVILQDLVMPQIDGLLLLKYLKANKKIKDIPLIVLSGEDQAQIKAQAFSLGADDYMVKLPDRLELLARIRHHSYAYIHLLERNEAFAKLAESEEMLGRELSAAASYMKTLLPKPLDGKVKINWKYEPSIHVGGDSLGYRWITDHILMMYILDVSGHGIRAALHSSSIVHVIHHLSDENSLIIQNPSELLQALNREFQMSHSDNMFFTIWYGIYNANTKELKFANAGHPPGILFEGGDPNKLISLECTGLAIGIEDDLCIQSKSLLIAPKSKLYLFSDGVYEIMKKDGIMWNFDDFVRVLKQPSFPGVEDMDRILDYTQFISGKTTFSDDFSLMEGFFE